MQSMDKKLERLKRFRLIDDTFMAKVFEENIECTQLVIRIILDRDDLIVQQVHTQHGIKNLQGHSVILDIYAVDTQGRRYDIEIQRADSGAIPRRARYHSSMMDVNLNIEHGEYGILPETYVIFLTENDVLGGGLPLYHIDRVIRETGQPFGDDAHILYVNGANKDHTPLGALMEDFFCSDPNRMHYAPLAERTRYFKENQEGVRTMCRIMEEMLEENAREVAEQVTKQVTEQVTKQVTEEVTKKVNEENARETARKLLGLGMLSDEQICKVTRLSLDRLKELKAQLLS